MSVVVFPVSAIRGHLTRVRKLCHLRAQALSLILRFVFYPYKVVPEFGFGKSKSLVKEAQLSQDEHTRKL